MVLASLSSSCISLISKPWPLDPLSTLFEFYEWNPSSRLCRVLTVVLWVLLSSPPTKRADWNLCVCCSERQREPNLVVKYLWPKERKSKQALTSQRVPHLYYCTQDSRIHFLVYFQCQNGDDGGIPAVPAMFPFATCSSSCRALQTEPRPAHQRAPFAGPYLQVLLCWC